MQGWTNRNLFYHVSLVCRWWKSRVSLNIFFRKITCIIFSYLFSFSGKNQIAFRQKKTFPGLFRTRENLRFDHEQNFFCTHKKKSIPSRRKNYFPLLCIGKLKINFFFNFSFLSDRGEIFTFDFHFEIFFLLDFITLTLWVENKKFFKAFLHPLLSHISKFQEFYDTHPVKAKAFVAFEMPRPTTNLIRLWSKVLLLL